MGPTTFCLTGPHGTHLGTPTWAFPCWSHLGPIFIFILVQPGYSHLGIPMLVPIGTHLYFHMGYTWALAFGHSHVGPTWDPYLFSYGIHLGTPNWASHVGPNWDPHLFLYGIHLGTSIWAFPCWSQLGPTSFFTWDILGHAHLGIPMLVPHGTHIFFHVGYTWACTLGHSYVGPK